MCENMSVCVLWVSYANYLMQVSVCVKLIWGRAGQKTCRARLLAFDRSIVGVSNNPTFELYATGSLGRHHAFSEVDLASLVIEDDDHEEGHGWDGEMGERNHASSKTLVDPLEVAEEGDESSLREEGAVHVDVDHALLGDGEVSGLANEKIGPLDADD